MCILKRVPGTSIPTVSELSFGVCNITGCLVAWHHIGSRVGTFFSLNVNSIIEQNIVNYVWSLIVDLVYWGTSNNPQFVSFNRAYCYCSIVAWSTLPGYCHNRFDTVQCLFTVSYQRITIWIIPKTTNKILKYVCSLCLATPHTM